MFLRDRPRLGAEWIGLLMAVAITVALAAATPRKPPSIGGGIACGGTPVDTNAPVATPTPSADELRARADLLYRQ